jgi:hypothetical protein
MREKVSVLSNKLWLPAHPGLRDQDVNGQRRLCTRLDSELGFDDLYSWAQAATACYYSTLCQ